MKKITAVVMTVILVVVVAAGLALAKSESKAAYKAGDTIYVCSCGAGCDCGTISRKAGKCSCSKDLVKSTVTKVADGKVYYMVGGKELSAPTAGKYACSCGSGCDCTTISQKPGKCSCGKEMKKVE